MEGKIWENMVIQLMSIMEKNLFVL
jgi:hypothetical protein